MNAAPSALNTYAAGSRFSLARTKSCSDFGGCWNVGRYELSSRFRGAADVWTDGHAVENRRLARRWNFRHALSYPVDCVRARAKKRDSFRVLGMQCARIIPVAGLFRDLSARFGRGVTKCAAAANLPAQFVFPLHASSAETSGRPTAGCGVRRKLLASPSTPNSLP